MGLMMSYGPAMLTGGIVIGASALLLYYAASSERRRRLVDVLPSYIKPFFGVSAGASLVSASPVTGGDAAVFASKAITGTTTTTVSGGVSRASQGWFSGLSK